MGSVGGTFTKVGINARHGFLKCQYDMLESFDYMACWQENVAFDVVLSDEVDVRRVNNRKARVDFPKRPKQEDVEFAINQISNHYPNTNKAYWGIVGLAGYYIFDAKMSKTGKRGSEFTVVCNKRRLFKTRDRNEAFKYAMKSKLENVIDSVVVVNQKNETVATVLLDETFCEKKPSKKSNDKRLVAEAYHFVYTVSAYVG